MKIECSRAETCYILYTMAFILFAFCGGFISYKVEMYFVMITYFWLFALVYVKEGKTMSLYLVFLVTYFIFLLARVFLNCIGAYDLTELNLYQNSHMSNEVAMETLSVITIFLIGTSYAWIIIRNKYKNRHTFSAVNRYSDDIKLPKTRLNDLLKAAYFVFIILHGAKNIYRLGYVAIYGYKLLFNGGMNAIGYPAILTGAATISELLFVVLMYYNRDKRSFRLYGGSMLVVYMLGFLTGQRGPAIIFLIYLIFLWSTYYEPIRVWNKKLIAVVIILPIFIQGMFKMRNNIEFSWDAYFGDNLYFSMLGDTGAIINVVAYCVMYGAQFTNKVPFLLGYFVDFFKAEPAGQVIEDITEGNYLGDHLMYHLDSTRYFFGNGTGTSIVAETYCTAFLSLLLTLMLAFLITYFVLKVEKNMYHSLPLFGIAYYLLRNFIYSPRDSIFKDLRSMVFVFLGCLVISLLSKRVSSKQVVHRRL